MNTHPAHLDEPRFPDSLAGALREAHCPSERVPADVDRAMLAAARGRAVVVRNRRSRMRIVVRWGSVASVAAAVAIAAIVWPRQQASPSPLPNLASGNAGTGEHRPSGVRQERIGGTGTGNRDINGDGAVDILDAYAIARAVDLAEEERVRAIVDRSKAAPLAEWDINGDGVVDRRDADAVAAGAVRLTSAGRG